MNDAVRQTYSGQFCRYASASKPHRYFVIDLNDPGTCHNPPRRDSEMAQGLPILFRVHEVGRERVRHKWAREWPARRHFIRDTLLRGLGGNVWVVLEMLGWFKKGEQHLEGAGEEPCDEVAQDDAPPGETENLLIIQHLCLIAGISAEIIADAKEHGGVDAEMLQSEADHYARLRAEAVQLADTITDEFYRGAAINFFIELCMKAREFKEARTLFRHQEIKKFREEIVEKYPEIVGVI